MAPTAGGRVREGLRRVGAATVAERRRRAEGRPPVELRYLDRASDRRPERWPA